MAKKSARGRTELYRLSKPIDTTVTNPQHFPDYLFMSDDNVLRKSGSQYNVMKFSKIHPNAFRYERRESKEEFETRLLTIGYIKHETKN